MNQNSLPHRALGYSGLKVSSLGLGCMGMSYSYGTPNDDESLRVLHRYLDLGGNFLDTAEAYGPHENEKLLGCFLREISRDQIVVATKFDFKIDLLFPPGVAAGERYTEQMMKMVNT